MDLQCPACKSPVLRKVSLVYREGLQSVTTRTQFSGVVVGTGGPDIVLGRATTKGIKQTKSSKALPPPRKWSYVKLFGWSVLVFLSVGWMIFYLNTITTNASSVSSAPLMTYAVLSSGVLVVLFLIYWTHNRFTYPRQYAQWDHSFICQRCGTVSKQMRFASMSPDIANRQEMGQ